MHTGGPSDPKRGSPPKIGPLGREEAIENEPLTPGDDRYEKGGSLSDLPKAEAVDRSRQRALWEVQAGLTLLAESQLVVGGERIAGASSVAELLALIAELGDGAVRRLVVQRAERRSAIAYASSTNPTTLFLDATFVALGHEFEGQSCVPRSELDADLGPTLSGQRALELAGRR